MFNVTLENPPHATLDQDRETIFFFCYREGISRMNGHRNLVGIKFQSSLDAHWQPEIYIYY